jgi:hypothetical protein
MNTVSIPNIIKTLSIYEGVNVKSEFDFVFVFFRLKEKYLYPQHHIHISNGI